MKLRAYHNPKNVDESRVPDGWRFRYACEAGIYAHTPCRQWKSCLNDFDLWEGYTGINENATYIVPVNA